ncbi:flagellin lysine-N-methylase [Lachnospiraceae bacterium ZAX-1]
MNITYDLYSKFSCASDCVDKCCKPNRWQIDIDSNTFKMYSNVVGAFGDELRAAIDSSNELARFRANENGYCFFYGDDGLCKLQKTWGHDKLSRTCRLYPRGGYIYNDILHLTLSLSCSEAAKLLLLHKEGLLFISRDENPKDLEYEKDPNLQIEKIGYNIRAFCIDILQNRTVPFTLRLVLIAQAFKDLSQFPFTQENEQKLTDIVALYTQRTPSPDLYEDSLNIKDTLLSASENIYTLLYDLMKQIINQKEVSDENVKFYEQINRFYEQKDRIGHSDIKSLKATLFDPYYFNHEYVFENYFVNSLFCTNFPMHKKGPLTAYLHILLDYLMLQVFIATLNFDKDNLTDEDIIYSICYFSQRTKNSGGYDRILDQMIDVLGGTDILSPVLCLLI